MFIVDKVHRYQGLREVIVEHGIEIKYFRIRPF